MYLVFKYICKKYLVFKYNKKVFSAHLWVKWNIVNKPIKLIETVMYLNLVCYSVEFCKLNNYRY